MIPIFLSRLFACFAVSLFSLPISACANAQRHAIETLTPIAAPASIPKKGTPAPSGGEGPSRTGDKVKDSQLIKALEDLNPIPPQAKLDATSRCPKFEFHISRANGRRGFLHDKLEPGLARHYLADHEFYIGFKYSCLFYLAFNSAPHSPTPPPIRRLTNVERWIDSAPGPSAFCIKPQRPEKPVPPVRFNDSTVQRFNAAKP